MACAFNAPFKGLQQGSNLIPLLSPWGALLFPWGALFLPLGGPCAALRVAQEWSSIRDIGRIFPRSLRLRPRPRACPTQPAQSYLLPLLYPLDQQGWPTKVTQDPGQYSQAWPFNLPSSLAIRFSLEPSIPSGDSPGFIFPPYNVLCPGCYP